MNPFDEYRKTYVTACFIIAVIYAFTLGGIFSTPLEDSLPATLTEGLPVSPRIMDRLLFYLTDGIIYGGMLYLTGIIFWNIFRFTIPANYNLKYKYIFISSLAISFCLLVIATETLAIYLCFPALFGVFVHSIPVRLFITLLLFVIIRLLYIYYNERHKITREEIGETKGILTGDTPSEETSLKGETFGNPLSGNVIPKPSNTEKTVVDRITVRSGQKIIIIPIDEVIFIKADGDYISINTAKGNWLKEQTMKYTEDMLPVDRFVRIHRSYIININYISRIERYGEKQQIILHNNEKIKISAARYQILKQVLDL